MMSIYVEIVAYDGILGDDGPKNQNQRRVFGKSDLQSFAVRKMIVKICPLLDDLENWDFSCSKRPGIL